MPPTRPQLGPVSPAFSFVEVILGMFILSLLAGLTITFYEEDSVRAREEAAQARLAEIAGAVKRWELANRRYYPYQELEPLAGRYLENLGTDPWGQPFAVESSRGFVYSWGANGVDDKGDGDDVRYPFRPTGTTEVTSAPVQVDVPPRAPTTGTFDLARKELRWPAPITFEDGSLLDVASRAALRTGCIA
ncbi:MAG: hypothetical protein HY814_05960 [Candidatus Riflebacteria bacterium]|nr:hypothetical protein [Candidatus Riflebacteria bacterium]